MDQPLFQGTLMVAYIHTQCKINRSKKYLLITPFLTVLVMEKVLLLLETIKKSLSMILLVMFFKDLTTLMIKKSKISLFVSSILLDKVLLLETLTDIMFTISIKKEDNGKKSFAKISKITTQLLRFVGKMMEVDLLLEIFVVQLIFMMQVLKKKRKESFYLTMFLQVKLSFKFKVEESKAF